MTAFVVDGRSIAPARRKIAEMRRRSTNLVPAWDAAVDWLANANRVQFGTRGARWRTPWRELTAGTLADKRRAGYTTDTLIRTSDLLRSLTDRPLSVERLAPREMTAGTAVRYARFHQEGTRRMPARPLLSASAVSREGAFSQAVASWVVRGRAEVRG